MFILRWWFSWGTTVFWVPFTIFTFLCLSLTTFICGLVFFFIWKTRVMKEGYIAQFFTAWGRTEDTIELVKKRCIRYSLRVNFSCLALKVILFYMEKEKILTRHSEIHIRYIELRVFKISFSKVSWIAIACSVWMPEETLCCTSVSESVFTILLLFLCHSLFSPELSLFGQYNYSCIVASA